MRRRGPNAEGSRVSGIRHWGGFIYNSSCGLESEASVMTIPHEAINRKAGSRSGCFHFAGPLSFSADGR